MFKRAKRLQYRAALCVVFRQHQKELEMGEGEWFDTFCSALRLAAEKRNSIAYRTGRICAQLNRDFRQMDSTATYRFYVGSYGRNSAIPSVSDVDVLYELPAALYRQY